MKTPNRYSEQQVNELLENGATLVTVNRRLARFSLSRYGQLQVQNGRIAWQTPDVLPYSAWLERCWESIALTGSPGGAPLPMLLSPHQERAVWQRIVGGSESGKALLHAGEAAVAVEQAYRLCRQWRVPMAPGAEWAATDPAAFLEWAAAFETLCRRENWIDRARLPGAVCDKIRDGALDPPEMVLFHGFDDISPQMAEMIETLERCNCRVGMQAADGRTGDAVRVGYADADEEIAAAAKWVRHRLERITEERIGVIVPRLEACRDQLVRVFDDVLHPEFLLANRPVEDRIYDISLGRPLSDYPVIRTAFSLLSLLAADPDTSALSSLLLTPYIAGGGTELPNRAVLDARLRENGAPRMSVDRLLGFMTRLGKKDPDGHSRCPGLYRVFSRFQRLYLDLPDTASPIAWSEAFTRILEAFGWPGDRPLTSHEYQTIAAWKEALARFAELGRIVPAMSEAEALSALSRMAGETLFQPEGPQVPVQILGMLEAAGERFDAVWILGMKQEVWPPAPSPNPFLPIALQRRLNLPHATPERELDYARQVTARLLASARELVVSYPLSEGDSECFPSPLIDHLPEVSVDLLASGKAPEYPRLLAGAASLEHLSDWQGPPLDASGSVAGGTGVLKAQAACPFCAFVGSRLGCSPLEQPVSGIDLAARGSLVHRALELVWDELKTHAELIGKSDEALGEIVSAAVAEAIRPMAERRPETFTERFTALERERVSGLLLEWLQREKDRMPFEVAEKETKRTVQVGDIRLTTFVDRFDRLEDGRMVIIDYKTGQPKMADWFTERIVEPQLPLYCMALDEPPAGVFFAQVRKGDTKFIGLADDDGMVGGIRCVADAGGAAREYGGIAEIVMQWKARLEILADEILRGHAHVAPVSVRTSCQYCRLACVCRIGEYAFLAERDPGSCE